MKLLLSLSLLPFSLAGFAQTPVNPIVVDENSQNEKPL
jgi:hypothetical protein